MKILAQLVDCSTSTTITIRHEFYYLTTDSCASITISISIVLFTLLVVELIDV